MNFKSGDTQTDRQTNRQTDKQTYFISPCWTATFAVKNSINRFHKELGQTNLRQITSSNHDWHENLVLRESSSISIGSNSSLSLFVTNWMVQISS